MQVGTLLTWADRILAFVETGDFLSAIELTRSYYVGEAPGNRNGLPDRPEELREVVGEKMRELMDASAHYAFSEERLTDKTHVTPDGRGVDRTSLFEGLVATCARACIALDDFEFLFEDLVNGTGESKAGYEKIMFCGEQAVRDSLQYFWVDTCCIDKWKIPELSHSINSMFRWYKNAAKCYAFLSDVSAPTTDAKLHQDTWEASFRESRWFTRGWTLQELLAPALIDFYSLERQRIGDCGDW